MIKGTIHQDDNIYQYICTQHWSTKIYKTTINSPKGRITVRNFNTLLTAMDKSSRQKVNKEAAALNNILNQKDLKIYTTECTFFSSAHGTLLRIKHMLGHKASLTNSFFPFKGKNFMFQETYTAHFQRESHKKAKMLSSPHIRNK